MTHQVYQIFIAVSSGHFLGMGGEWGKIHFLIAVSSYIAMAGGRSIAKKYGIELN